jgi:hypothetical protein
MAPQPTLVLMASDGSVGWKPVLAFSARSKAAFGRRRCKSLIALASRCALFAIAKQGQMGDRGSKTAVEGTSRKRPNGNKCSNI